MSECPECKAVVGDQDGELKEHFNAHHPDFQDRGRELVGRLRNLEREIQADYRRWLEWEPLP